MKGKVARSVTQINRLELFRMRSPVLLLKPQNTTTSRPVLKKLHWLKIPERIEYKVISLTYNMLQSSQPSYLRQLVMIQPPRSTRSSSTLTLLRPSVTSVTEIFQSLHSRSCPASLEQTPPALRHISESSYELTQTSPLKISPRLFHSKLKTLLFGKSYPDLSSSSCLPPRLNSKHHGSTITSDCTP